MARSCAGSRGSLRAGWYSLIAVRQGASRKSARSSSGLVMDIRLPDGTGVDACREIRGERPETRVIMLTSYADDEAIYGSIMAGASGYLLKQTRGQNLAGSPKEEPAVRASSSIDS